MHAKIIVIGASAGGLKAVRFLLSRITVDFQIPMVIVLHRGKESDDFLLELLQSCCALPVHEAQDKSPVAMAQIYLAPADYHLLIEEKKFALSVDPPVSMARPSIDVLFETCAVAYGNHAIGVILTGSGHDGAEGLARIQACGGRILVEDPQTAETADMPQAAIVATNTDQVYSLAKISSILAALH